MGATAAKIEAAVKAAEGYREGNPQDPACRRHGRSRRYGPPLRAARRYRLPFPPACASFDMYPNFEARGNHFKALVNAAT